MGLEIEDRELLQYAVSQGIINLDDVRNNMKEKEKQRILKQHIYKVFQSKDGRWKTTFPDDSRRSGRRLVAKSTKEKLEEEIIAFYTGKEDKRYISTVDPTLTDLYPEWIIYRDSLTKSSSTIKRFKSVWNTWYKDKEISQIHLSDLDYLYLNQWANSIVKNNELDRKAYYLIVTVVKQILEYAVEKKYITDNPFSKVKVNKKMFRHKRKQDSSTQVFLSNEQKAIAEAAREKIEARPWCVTPLFILLNFQLGLRIGELAALKQTDINGNYITISRMETVTYKVTEDGEVLSNGFKVVPYVKSEAGYRDVYLNAVAKDLLSEIRKLNLKYGYYDEGYLFIASRTKKRGTSRTLTKYLETLCSSAGIANKSSHKIRKTYISSLFDNGVNINTIREQAGHEDEKTSLNNYCFDQKDLSEREAELEKAANQRMII